MDRELESLLVSASDNMQNEADHVKWLLSLSLSLSLSFSSIYIFFSSHSVWKHVR